MIPIRAYIKAHYTGCSTQRELAETVETLLNYRMKVDKVTHALDMGMRLGCTVAAIGKNKAGRWVIRAQRLAINKTNTDIYGNFWAAMMTGAAAAGTKNISIKNTSGTAETVYLYSGTGNNCFGFVPTGKSGGLNAVQLGTGTTPATRADFKLQTPISGTITEAWSYASGQCSASGTINYGTAQAPTEVVFMLSPYVPSLTDSDFFVFDHTVFSALPSSTSFIIAYSMNLA